MLGKKRSHAWITLLQAGYIAIIILLALLIVTIPFLVKSNFAAGKNLILVEEIIECALLALTLLVGYVILRLYHDQMQKAEKKAMSMEEKLRDAFEYIGKVNVQIKAIGSIFDSIKRYPQTKAYFDQALSSLSQSVLGIVNVNWIEFRIIHLETLQTIREYHEARGGREVPQHNTSNRAMTAGELVSGYSIVGSGWENLTVKAFCILPIEGITENQRIFLRALVGELEMLFVIFTSQYYKKDYLKTRGELEYKSKS